MTDRTIQTQLDEAETELTSLVASRQWDEVIAVAHSIKHLERLARTFTPQADYLQALIGHRVVR